MNYPRNRYEFPVSLAFKYKIVFCYLFGSQVTEGDKKLNDIDLGIYFSSDSSKNEQFDLRISLISELLLLWKTNKHIDLVIMNDAPITMQFNIIDQGEVIYCENEIKLADFRERTWKYYFDFQIFETQYLKYRLEG